MLHRDQGINDQMVEGNLLLNYILYTITSLYYFIIIKDAIIL